MEKQRKSSGVVAVSCAALLVMMAGAAQAEDTAMINFSGTVIPATCTYAQTTNIPLAPVVARNLDTAGATAGLRKFDIGLSNCPAGVSVRAGFLVNPAFVDISTGTLKNLKTGSDAATEVNIALTDRDGALVHVGSQTEAPVVVDNAGKATLTYGAEYYALSNRVTAGDVLASVGFEVEYQ